MAERHTIEVDEDVDNDRSYWQCDCGAAGSCSPDRADIAAELHVPKDAFVVWRYPGRRDV